MTNTLKLTEKQTHFLEEHRKDPITGDSFSLGDTIVFCAECKSAFTKESWEYIGSKHCNQRRTLNYFPPNSTLKLKKDKIQNTEETDIRNRFGAFMFDIIIGCVPAFIAMCVFVLHSAENYMKGFDTESYTIGLTVLSMYMIFRDIFTLKGSLGKKIFGLYFVSSKKENKPIYIQTLLRNLIYWIPVIIAYILFDKNARGNDFLNTMAVISSMITGLFNMMIYPLSFLVNKRSVIDRLLSN